MVLAIGFVGLLKQLTNVDCPWDLQLFGGRFPYVSLFGERSRSLRAAHCFPAAHASSGYALMTLYFVVRERSRAWAAAALPGVADGQAVNLGSGLRLSVNDLIAEVCRVLGRDPASYPLIRRPRRPGDQQDAEADIHRAKAFLGWEPTIDFPEGLRRTIAWAKQAGG